MSNVDGSKPFDSLSSPQLDILSKISSLLINSLFLELALDTAFTLLHTDLNNEPSTLALAFKK